MANQSPGAEKPATEEDGNEESSKDAESSDAASRTMCPRRMANQSQGTDKPTKEEDGKEESGEDTESDDAASRTLCPTACVGVRKDGVMAYVRVLLDTGSNRCGVSLDLSRELDLPVVRKEVCRMFGLGVEGEPAPATARVVGARLHSVRDPDVGLDLELVELERFPAADYPPPRASAAVQGAGLDLADPPGGGGGRLLRRRIHVIIGADVHERVLTGRTRRLANGLAALETVFGWCLLGKEGPPRDMPVGPQAPLTVEKLDESKGGQTAPEQDGGVVFCPTARVDVVRGGGREGTLRLLVDTGSTMSCISADASRRMDLPVVRRLSKMAHAYGMPAPRRLDFDVVRATLRSRLDPAVGVELDLNRIQEYAFNGRFPRPRPWPSLGLALADQPRGQEVADDAPVDVIVGTDYYSDLVTGRVERLDNGLLALETVFGWCLLGKARPRPRTVVQNGSEKGNPPSTPKRFFK